MDEVGNQAAAGYEFTVPQNAIIEKTAGGDIYSVTGIEKMNIENNPDELQ